MKCGYRSSNAAMKKLADSIQRKIDSESIVPNGLVYG